MISENEIGSNGDTSLLLAQKQLDSHLISVSWAFASASRLQGKDVDRHLLHDAVKSCAHEIDLLIARGEVSGGDDYNAMWQRIVEKLASSLGVAKINSYLIPDPARLPAITWHKDFGWGVVRALTPRNQWLIDFEGVIQEVSADGPLACVRLEIQAPSASESGRPVFKLFKKQFVAQKKILIEAGCAGVLINVLAIITSLYSMQIYDRVIPTQGYSTLFVLTVGVVAALFFDLLVKISRSHLMESFVVEMDSRLSREIVARLLNIRLDQFPSSVGTLSSQLRGYETIRGFLSASTFYLMVDLPFSIIFILLIMLIGSPLVGLVPLAFFGLAIGFGLVMRGKVDGHASEGAAAGNLKTGLLVEAIEGAETIKSGAGNWGFLSKWIDVTKRSMDHELALRGLTEKATYFTGMMQQVSYVGLIATGAYWAGEGNITTGSLIACSILSGRALASISQMPSLIVQGAHAKAALASLEKVYTYEVDNHGVDRPLLPNSIVGGYQLEHVRFSYRGAPKPLTINRLSISPGEKIGILGPVGSGKSTLLRLLSGMYQPGEGRILLDGLDMDQISRQFLSEKIGYLQQDHRLFSGTLRENLLIGMPDPGDELVKQAATKTGLIGLIANHPKGLDMVIQEGGKGLSGGQRQLVALTRLLIGKPSIWLLDEPTASMDSVTENTCIAALKECVERKNTLLVVTHKSSLLPLVDRLIVVANNQILLDGERESVLQKLSSRINGGQK